MNTEKAHLNPAHDLIPNLVYYCTGSDVDTAIVDGKVVVENGEMKTVDEDQAIKRARKLAERIWVKYEFPPVLV